MKNGNKPTPTRGWPFPGSWVWCGGANMPTGNTVRIKLVMATKYNNGGMACEGCMVRQACSRLHAELSNGQSHSF